MSKALAPGNSGQDDYTVQLLAMPVFQAPSTIQTALALRPANLAVPTSEQEQQPSVVRYWRQFMGDRRPAEAPGLALLFTQAILAPSA